MNVHKYKTTGGKDVIIDYINSLSKVERVDGLTVLKCLEENRMDELTIDRWQGKVYEIYFYRHNRLFYVAIENTDAYLLHACRKQKNKTEKADSDKVIRRAKEVGEKLGKKFI